MVDVRFHVWRVANPEKWAKVCESWDESWELALHTLRYGGGDNADFSVGNRILHRESETVNRHLFNWAWSYWYAEEKLPNGKTREQGRREFLANMKEELGQNAYRARKETN